MHTIDKALTSVQNKNMTLYFYNLNFKRKEIKLEKLLKYANFNNYS